jgi:hypothetical protein
MPIAKRGQEELCLCRRLYQCCEEHRPHYERDEEARLTGRVVLVLYVYDILCHPIARVLRHRKSEQLRQQ